jgi:hypothetical protein
MKKETKEVINTMFIIVFALFGLFSAMLSADIYPITLWAITTYVFSIGGGVFIGDIVSKFILKNK